MGFLHQFFTLDELKGLDLKAIEILKATIQNEIRNSPAIKEALRASVRRVYTELREPGSGGSGQKV